MRVETGAPSYDDGQADFAEAEGEAEGEAGRAAGRDTDSELDDEYDADAQVQAEAATTFENYIVVDVSMKAHKKSATDDNIMCLVVDSTTFDPSNPPEKGAPQWRTLRDVRMHPPLSDACDAYLSRHPGLNVATIKFGMPPQPCLGHGQGCGRSECRLES